MQSRKAVFSVAFLGLSVLAQHAGAQTPNLFQSLKDTLNKAAQQLPQPQPAQGQPGQSQQPVQPQARPQQRPAPPQPAANAVANDSGSFTPPAGTKIDQAPLAPLQQGGRRSVRMACMWRCWATAEAGRS
jgi:hypothetical protein